MHEYNFEISGIINTAATTVIAVFTWLNFLMYKDIQKRDEEYKAKTCDLFQAITLATLLSGSSGTSTAIVDEMIKIFNDKYSGKTKVF